jgi:hypothetical protein
MELLKNFIICYNLEYVVCGSLVFLIIAYLRGWFEFDVDRSGNDGSFGEADSWF